MTFFDGNTPLGTGSVNPARQATLATTTLAVGTHTIRAEYAGDGSFAGSTSGPLTQVVAFADVPATHPLLTWIQALFAAGITTGCATSPPQYCPDVAVTRAQMAVFLLRSVHGAGYEPPPATGLFTDVALNDPFAPWIEELAREGITSGCSTAPLRYCPGAAVTRGQIAVFLLRAKHGASHSPPDATGVFAAVPVSPPPGHPFADWIEDLARAGVTGGCSTSPPLYCPDAPVTRAQMAVFLVRVFDLPL